jgi:BirA family biotin operon repressor/biotin-[acetyl-CoA-carboxylase] ligase
VEATWEGRSSSEWRQQLGVPAVELFGTIGSTNDVARDLAERGAASLTLVVADHQTSGRGRAGRSWLSTPGSSLLCSIVFRVADTGDSAPGAAPVRIGNAVAETIAEVAAVDARVKWPNDVVIPAHGKVAGVLCEAVMRQGSAFVIAGIGVNVSSPGETYVSLSQASGRQVSRADVLQRIIEKLRKFADDLTHPLSADELERIRARDILFEQKVTDETGLVGVAAGIAADGSLLVKKEQGTIAVHNATIRLADTHQYPGANV